MPYELLGWLRRCFGDPFRKLARRRAASEIGQKRRQFAIRRCGAVK
jgi:hypothetical protein